MKLDDLKRYEMIYVGTPYSKFPGGIELAFEAAARVTARLMKAGLKVYSPIAHTHPIAIHGKMDPLDHNIWLPFDAAMMRLSEAMIVATFPTWETSYGVTHEIDVFTKAGKPVFWVNPVTLDVTEWQMPRETTQSTASRAA